VFNWCLNRPCDCKKIYGFLHRQEPRSCRNWRWNAKRRGWKSYKGRFDALDDGFSQLSKSNVIYIPVTIQWHLNAFDIYMYTLNIYIYIYLCILDIVVNICKHDQWFQYHMLIHVIYVTYLYDGLIISLYPVDSVKTVTHQISLPFGRPTLWWNRHDGIWTHIYSKLCKYQIPTNLVNKG
jgi:hypothetical protein